jgi:hypothetical protein
LMEMSQVPEIILAVGTASSGIVLAFVGWQHKMVKDLQARVEVLEADA